LQQRFFQVKVFHKKGLLLQKMFRTSDVKEAALLRPLLVSRLLSVGGDY